MERRRFAKVVGGGVLALLGGAGLLASRRTRMVALPAEPLRFFTPREYSVFTAVAEAIVVVPAGQPDVHSVQVAAKADRLLARNSDDVRADYRKLLGLFDNALAGAVLTGTFTPFSQLSIPDRQAFLAKWQDHPIPLLRSGYVGLKRTAMACYYASPESYAGVGYPGPLELM